MFVLAVNGSPRKTWNTATLLARALEGAASKGAATELVHLYDLTYTGCKSCFSCKKIGGKHYGRCKLQDDLAPVLAKVPEADALILGSPFYFGVETGAMRAFMERLLFPYLTYTPGYKGLFPRKIPTAFVYTMNVTEANLPASGQDRAAEHSSRIMARTFGSCELFYCTDTLQFSDYAKYLSTAFDPAAKTRRHAEVFPKDCERAFALGARLADQAATPPA